MKELINRKKRYRVVLAGAVVLSLVFVFWLSSAAAARPTSMQGALQAQATATANPAILVPTPAAGAGQAPTNWLGFILLLFCSMVGLLVVGVGAAVLLVRLRERLRK